MAVSRLRSVDELSKAAPKLFHKTTSVLDLEAHSKLGQPNVPTKPFH